MLQENNFPRLGDCNRFRLKLKTIISIDHLVKFYEEFMPIDSHVDRM